MDTIEDWHEYSTNSNSWDQLSLNPLSLETTMREQEHLNWLIIATQWPIDDTFFQTFRHRLLPHIAILRLRNRLGFLSLRTV